MKRQENVQRKYDRGWMDSLSIPDSSHDLDGFSELSGWTEDDGRLYFRNFQSAACQPAAALVDLPGGDAQRMNE